MQNWDDRILGLLNRSESDAICCALFDDLNLLNSPVTCEQLTPHYSIHYFHEFGVAIHSIDKRIWSVVFYFNSDSKTSMLPYVNGSPLGLNSKLTREDVHSVYSDEIE